MDLNPHPPNLWTLEGGPYEIADYCRSSGGKSRTNILVLLNAWLDSKEDIERKWDHRTLNYWLARLRPLWDREHDELEAGLGSDVDSADEGSSNSKETIVIICNRSGDDNGELHLCLRVYQYDGADDHLFVRLQEHCSQGLRLCSDFGRARVRLTSLV